MRYLVVVLLAIGLTACGEEPKKEVNEKEKAEKADTPEVVSEGETEEEEVGETTSEEENTTTEEQTFSGPAKMKFASRMHDFGVKPVGDSVVTFYEFQNVGGEDLEITKTKASCDCTGVQYDKGPYKSGEKGKVRVSYPTVGKEGELINKTVMIWTNADKRPMELRFTLEVEEE